MSLMASWMKIVDHYKNLSGVGSDCVCMGGGLLKYWGGQWLPWSLPLPPSPPLSPIPTPLIIVIQLLYITAYL